MNANPILRLLADIRTTPSRWLLAVLLVFMFFPGLDIGAARLFWGGEAGAWTGGGLIEFFRRVVPTVIVGSFVFCVVLWVAGIWYQQWFWGLTTPRMIYLMSTLVVGPGLTVETLLKPNWGRARPKDITVFGGTADFTPPLWIADECTRNCSFVSGHAAVAFWVTAYGFILNDRWRWPAVAAGILFGGVMGLMRMMQGAHFLSDIVWAGILVLGVNATFYTLIFRRGVLRRFIREM
ncbi:MAG: phosphatase PAP2 family protein [Rhodospirillaceae bacterium]|nr:phosphatase PAP2 family protein [Rhodospirillaceae bacterium]